jgi:hypothetical protein
VLLLRGPPRGRQDLFHVLRAAAPALRARALLGGPTGANCRSGTHLDHRSKQGGVRGQALTTSDERVREGSLISRPRGGGVTLPG